MRILVTGARGKVGAAAVATLADAGHEVTACDLGTPTFERPGPVAYLQADMADAGSADAVVAGQDAVIHAAAIPDPIHHPPHVVFHNNLMGVFNAVEACVRLGVRRLVNVSSETVPGFVFPERPFTADYAPVDEEHPIRPQDPYALAKHFGEQLMDAAARRSDLTGVSVRPTWVQWEGNYERNLGPIVRGPDEPSASFWSYVDVDDLADLLVRAATTATPAHEVLYAAAADNATGRPLEELIRRHHADAVEVRPHERADASGISTARAAALLGWTPRRGWRDVLDAEGRLLPDPAARLERGETRVQRGRQLTGS
jgi:nucleoside-diphosphate-sugar epimerase